ncbi:MAG TPA: ATP-grasp domain-containing protein, partial [Spirochaetota bacterium]|nr:ATP-grasp domain-containing protein [Spirochaetota bacterium]
DTCAAEFKAETPYYYSCYDEETEVKPPAGKNIIILGGGPNRIGQGIEFDYMCVKASFALQEMGYRSIMINSNPETVSTDYDVSNILYFEPVVFENVMDIVEQMQPEGVITQLGGQTPLNNAQRLEQNRVAMVGTSAASIAIAEDREQFKQILNKHNFKQPANATAFTGEEACKIAADIGFPVLIRPSYVLGGRAMEIVYDKDELIHYVNQAIDISSGQPILIDKYLEKAIEIDVDCICDGEDVVICGIMEHIEEAGIHSGDSACILPPQHIPAAVLKTIKKQTREMAFAMNVKGLMNVQYAVKDDTLYFLEVNPRGSRTVPFISKATGVPWIKYAVKVMAGHKIKDINIREKKI